LRRLLAERSGLSIAEVYPTPWHQPFIETFSRGYGRARPLDFDVKEMNGTLVAVDEADGRPAQPGGVEHELGNVTPPDPGSDPHHVAGAPSPSQ